MKFKSKLICFTLISLLSTGNAYGNCLSKEAHAILDKNGMYPKAEEWERMKRTFHHIRRAYDDKRTVIGATKANAWIVADAKATYTRSPDNGWAGIIYHSVSRCIKAEGKL